MNTPMRLPFLTRLKPSAMLTPARSCLGMTGLIPSLAASSISDCAGKQLSHSTPSAFRIFAMSLLAFMHSLSLSC